MYVVYLRNEVLLPPKLTEFKLTKAHDLRNYKTFNSHLSRGVFNIKNTILAGVSPLRKD